jgi:hypothetical protein
MVFSGKHNRNARRGQSLFTAARHPWPFFVARRRAIMADLPLILVINMARDVVRW